MVPAPWVLGAKTRLESRRKNFTPHTIPYVVFAVCQLSNESVALLLDAMQDNKDLARLNLYVAQI